jgi:hypothetical protein
MKRGRREEGGEAQNNNSPRVCGRRGAAINQPEQQDEVDWLRANQFAATRAHSCQSPFLSLSSSAVLTTLIRLQMGLLITAVRMQRGILDDMEIGLKQFSRINYLKLIKFLCIIKCSITNTRKKICNISQIFDFF